MIEMSVQISEERAGRLEELAAERNTTEDALIEAGLDLLFRQEESRSSRREGLDADLEEISQLEVEVGPAPRLHARPIPLDGATLIAGTPVPPGLLRRSK